MTTTPDTREGLLPCPFCGSPDLRSAGVIVECNRCEASGPWNRGKAGWNTRPSSPATPVDGGVVDLDRLDQIANKLDYMGWYNSAHTIRRAARAIAVLNTRAALEALTPSGDTKAAYHGEFSIDVPLEGYDEDGEPLEGTKRVPVPWDTVKEIMAAIRERAALAAMPQPAVDGDAKLREALRAEVIEECATVADEHAAACAQGRGNAGAMNDRHAVWQAESERLASLSIAGAIRALASPAPVDSRRMEP